MESTRSETSIHEEDNVVVKKNWQNLYMIKVAGLVYFSITCFVIVFFCLFLLVM